MQLTRKKRGCCVSQRRVQALEWLDAGEAISAPIRRTLQDILRRIPQGLHALLIIDSKVRDCGRLLHGSSAGVDRARRLVPVSLY